MERVAAKAGFAAALRDATHDAHERAERMPFVAALLAGQIDERGYVEYLVQLDVVYRALEGDTTALTADPDARRFLTPGLHRGAAIAADGRFWGGARWQEAADVSSATRAYADRVTRVRQTWPAGYIAHHYTRYLGDISGGQIIAGAVRRRFGVAGLDGLRLYAFDALASPRRFRDSYRAALDAAAWDAGEREGVIAEARAAFGHNQALLGALGQAGRRRRDSRTSRGSSEMADGLGSPPPRPLPCRSDL